MAIGPSKNISVDYGSQFGYLDQKRNLRVKLWPFGPNGWERFVFEGSESERDGVPDYDGLRFKHDLADDVLDEVLRKSGHSREALLNELGDLSADTRVAYPAPNADAAEAGNATHHPPPVQLQGLDDVGNAPVELQGLDDNTVLFRLAADTCLWLLVVFSILGAKPDFPDKHAIFGSRCVTADKEMWFRSIFFVGNQIPSFWVEKLMESLSYLKNLSHQVARQGKPSELLQRTLFEFVTGSQVPQTDVIACLRSIILGSKPPNRDKIHIWMVGSNPNNMVKQQLSASALYEKGYTFKSLPKILGYRGIKCTHRMEMVEVWLPALMVDDKMNLELTMTSVRNWEQIHCGPNTEHQPECTWFFNLLYNLIRGKDDVRVLSFHNVIGGGKVMCLPDILSNFYETPNYDSHLCQVKEIREQRPVIFEFMERFLRDATL